MRPNARDNRKFSEKCLPSQIFLCNNKSMHNCTFNLQNGQMNVSVRDRKWETHTAYGRKYTFRYMEHMRVCVRAFKVCLQFKWTSGCYLLKSIFALVYKIHELIHRCTWMHLNSNSSAGPYTSIGALEALTNGWEPTKRLNPMSVYPCAFVYLNVLKYYFGSWMLDATINAHSFQSYRLVLNYFMGCIL